MTAAALPLEGPGRIRRANEARLLAAATRVFAERGFTGATTAEIAARAGLPKANLHYYYGTKEALYSAVVTGILELWLGAFDPFGAAERPAAALARYVETKMRLSFERPLESRIFARELLAGAPVIRPYLETELRAWVEARAAVVRAWIDQGLIAPIEPVHLFFTIWAATQTYADFAVQIRAVLGKAELDEDDRRTATEATVALVLRGCGLDPKTAGIA